MWAVGLVGSPRLEHGEETWKYLNRAIPRMEVMEENFEEGTTSVDLTSSGDTPSEAASTNTGKQKGTGVYVCVCVCYMLACILIYVRLSSLCNMLYRAAC